MWVQRALAETVGWFPQVPPWLWIWLPELTGTVTEYCVQPWVAVHP